MKIFREIIIRVRIFFLFRPELVISILCFLTSIFIQFLIKVDTTCHCQPILENPHRILSTVKRCVSKECFEDISLYNKPFGVGKIKNEHMLSYFNIMKANKGDYCYFPSLKQQKYGCPDILKFDNIKWPLIDPLAWWIELTNLSEGKSNGIKFPYFICQKVDPKIQRFIDHNTIIGASGYVLDIQVKPGQNWFINESRFADVKYNAVTYDDFRELLDGMTDAEMLEKLESQANNNHLYKERIELLLLKRKKIIDEAIGLSKD